MTTPVEIPASAPKKRISGAWYALVALPWLAAIAIWYTHLPRVIAGFADLTARTHVTRPAPDQRESDLEMLGKNDLEVVELRAGANTIYVEGVERGGDTQALTELTCAVVGPDGAFIPLQRDTSMTMSLNARTYVSQYTLEVERADTHGIACTSPVPAHYSLGRTFPFMSIVWLVLSLALALPLTGVIGYLVNRVRNPKKPRPPAAPPLHRAL